MLSWTKNAVYACSALIERKKPTTAQKRGMFDAAASHYPPTFGWSCRGDSILSNLLWCYFCNFVYRTIFVITEKIYINSGENSTGPGFTRSQVEAAPPGNLPPCLERRTATWQQVGWPRRALPVGGIYQRRSQVVANVLLIVSRVHRSRWVRGSGLPACLCFPGSQRICKQWFEYT